MSYPGRKGSSGTPHCMGGWEPCNKTAPWRATRGACTRQWLPKMSRAHLLTQSIPSITSIQRQRIPWAHHTRCQFSCLFKRFIWGHTGLYNNIFKVNKLRFSHRASRNVCGQKCNSHKDPGDKAEPPFTCAEAEECGTASVTTHTCLRKRSPSEGITWGWLRGEGRRGQEECSILMNINHQMELDFNLEPLNRTCSFYPVTTLGTSPAWGDCQDPSPVSNGWHWGRLALKALCFAAPVFSPSSLRSSTSLHC